MNLFLTKQGMLTGTWDTKARTVTFHLETTEVTSFNDGSGDTYSLVFDGMGALSTDTQAAGSAQWTATCKVVGGLACGHDANGNLLSSWDAAGTVPFTIVAGH